MTTEDTGEYGGFERRENDRRKDPISRKRIIELERRYERIARRLTLAVAIIGLTLTVVTFITIALIQANKHRSQQIQDERRRVTVGNCLAQNARHDAAINALQERLKHVQGPIPAANLAPFTISLINAITPKRDCAKVAAAAVKVR